MKKIMKNDKGLTLVEVLASTILISLILMTFLMMFAQAGKTNVASEMIVDSTYTAQEEMEKIYGLSKKISPSNKASAFPTTQYETAKPVSKDEINWTEYTKKNTPSNEKIKVRIDTSVPNAKMTRVIVEVYEGAKTNPSAKMENVLVWEGTP